ERVLADTEEARVKMTEVQGGTLGVVRVGVIPTVAAHFLPSVLQDFKARFPKVTVLLREASRTPQLISLLEAGEIDLSFGLDQVKTGGTKSIKLLTEELCLAVSTQHPLSARTSLPIGSL